MNQRVDRFCDSYGRFEDTVFAAIRTATFVADIGQNSWLTATELESFVDGLQLQPEHHVLEVAGGSGGPAQRVAEFTECRVTGIDANEDGIARAIARALASDLSNKLHTRAADANQRLPFEDASFDGLVCIDALNHLRDRKGVFAE